MKFRIFLLLLLLVSYNSYSQSPPVTYISYGLVSIGEPSYVSDDSIAIPVTFRYYEALKRFGLISGANEYYLYPKVNIAYSNANVKKQWYQEYSNNFESARGTSWRRAYSKKIATTDSVVSFTYGIGNLSQSVKGTVYSIQPYFLMKIGLGRQQTTSGIAYQDAFSFVIFPRIQNNYITSGNQVLCPQGSPPVYTPRPITAAMPGGGSGSYAFTWQSSTDGIVWSNANINGNRDTGYLPDTIMRKLPYSTVFYRRIVTDGTQADTSNAVSVTYLPAGYQPVMNITTEGSTNTALSLALNINNSIDPYNVTWYDSIAGTKSSVINGVNGDHLTIALNNNIPGHIYTAKVSYDASCPTYSSRNIHITPPDGDGNYYAAVRIGSQLWTINNLKTTRYNDRTPIMQSIAVRNPPRYSWYGNDSLLYAGRYGALYNIQVINNGNKNVCPTGWQVADMMNWLELLERLGGQKGTAILLKSSSTWNEGAGQSNAYNFNALPGGQLNTSNSYNGESLYGTWWGMIPSVVSPATMYQSSYFQMISNDNNVYFVDPSGTSNEQHSIRCISR